MRKSKIYLFTGIIALQLGACMIHSGLGLMLIGGLLLFGSYMEYNKDNKEE